MTAEHSRAAARDGQQHIDPSLRWPPQVSGRRLSYFLCKRPCLEAFVLVLLWATKARSQSSKTTNRRKRKKEGRRRCYVPLPTNQATTNFSGTVQRGDAGKGFAAARRHCHPGHLSLLRRRLRATH